MRPRNSEGVGVLCTDHSTQVPSLLKVSHRISVSSGKAWTSHRFIIAIAIIIVAFGGCDQTRPSSHSLSAVEEICSKSDLHSRFVALMPWSYYGASRYHVPDPDIDPYVGYYAHGSWNNRYQVVLAIPVSTTERGTSIRPLFDRAVIAVIRIKEVGERFVTYSKPLILQGEELDVFLRGPGHWPPSWGLDQSKPLKNFDILRLNVPSPSDLWGKNWTKAWAVGSTTEKEQKP